jgi:hypothetical protein
VIEGKKKCQNWWLLKKKQSGYLKIDSLCEKMALLCTELIMQKTEVFIKDEL